MSGSDAGPARTLSEHGRLACECRDRSREDLDEQKVLNQCHDEHPAEGRENEIVQ